MLSEAWYREMPATCRLLLESGHAKLPLLELAAVVAPMKQDDEVGLHIWTSQWLHGLGLHLWQTMLSGDNDIIFASGRPRSDTEQTYVVVGRKHGFARRAAPTHQTFGSAKSANRSSDKDLQRNMTWLKPVVIMYPQGNPSVYLIGDALLLLNERVHYNMFVAKPGLSEDRQALHSEAIEMAADIKRLVSKLRKIDKRESKGSHDPDIAELKSVLLKNTKYHRKGSSSSSSSALDATSLVLQELIVEQPTPVTQESYEHGTIAATLGETETSQARSSMEGLPTASQMLQALSQMSSDVLESLCEALHDFMQPTEDIALYVCSAPEGSQPILDAPLALEDGVAHACEVTCLCFDSPAGSLFSARNCLTSYRELAVSQIYSKHSFLLLEPRPHAVRPNKGARGEWA